MLPEILSIIAVCISGVTAICSACVPAILNAKTKKEELALKREIEYEKLKREREQENEIKFEEYYQSHLKVLTDFSEYYVQWGSTFSEIAKSQLVSYVNRLAAQFRNNVQSALNDFAQKVNTFYDDDNLDKDYKNCVNLILNSFGVQLSGGFPDILLPDILKSALKKQFLELQNLKADSFGRFYFHKK